jgi:hypothetical protein
MEEAEHGSTWKKKAATGDPSFDVDSNRNDGNIPDPGAIN